MLSELMRRVGAGGNLVNDAHVSALAIEHRASLVTYDTDFGKFGDVPWHTPDALLA